MRWTRNDSLAFDTISKAGEQLRNAYERAQLGNAYNEGMQVQERNGAEVPAQYAEGIDDAGQLGYNKPQYGLGKNPTSWSDTAPTRMDKHRAGLESQAGFLAGRGDTERANAIYAQIESMKDKDAERAWRSEQQGQLRGQWDREQQGRDVIQRSQMYSPQAYQETQQALRGLGAEGDEARKIYGQHFSTTQSQAMRNAGNELMGLGRMDDAKAMFARAEMFQKEGFGDIVKAVRAGVSGDALASIFNGSGEMRIDSVQGTKLIKGEKGKPDDYEIAYTKDGKAGTVRLSKIEENLVSPEKLMELKQKAAEAEALRDLRREIAAARGSRGVGGTPKIDPEMAKEWDYLEKDMRAASAYLDKLSNPKEGETRNDAEIERTRDRLQKLRVREYEILKQAGQMPANRTIGEHLGLDSPDAGFRSVVDMVLAGKRPSPTRENPNATAPISAKDIDDTIAGLRREYKYAPEMAAPYIKKLETIKRIQFSRPLQESSDPPRMDFSDVVTPDTDAERQARSYYGNYGPQGFNEVAPGMSVLEKLGLQR